MSNFMNSILSNAALGASQNQIPVGKGKFIDADKVKDVLALNSECASISLNLRGDDKAAVDGKSLYAVMKLVSPEELLGVISGETITAMLAHYIEAFSRDIAKEAFKEEIANGKAWSDISFAIPDLARIAEMLTDEFSDQRSGGGVANLSEEEVTAIYQANFMECIVQQLTAKGIQPAQLVQVHGAYRGLLTLLFSRSAKSKMRPELLTALERFIDCMPPSEALDLVKARRAQVIQKQKKESDAFAGLML